MHIAFCTQSTSFHQDRLRDKQLSYRYPGAGWVTMLYNKAALQGLDMASGDVALDNVTRGLWRAQDVWVLQDMESEHGAQLLQAGAVPFLITCLEAPLYAPFFYDNIARISSGFKFRWGFGFNNEVGKSEQSTIECKFRFPSFYLDDVVELNQLNPWSKRSQLTLIAANKFKSNKLFYPSKSTAFDLLRHLKWMTWRARSSAYRRSLSVSLHEERLEAMDYFSRHGTLNLYGSGWGDMHGIPLAWSRRLSENLGLKYLGTCESKLQVLKAHRFSLCFENTEMPGYITEKMIDCFVSGTIPVYRGAPDVSDYIPAGSFIRADASKYEQISMQLDSMDDAGAQAIIEKGREYLASDVGCLHSYEGFADHVLRLAGLC
jgi:hypothetical protein